MKTKDRILTATNYTYLEPVNATHAKKMATQWGSSSNYINFLIAKDRGDKKSMKASRELQETFFTPCIARTRADRVGEAAKGKKKAGKKKPAKRGLVKAKSKKSSRSKKKSASRASSSNKRKTSVARAAKKTTQPTTVEAVA